MCLSAKYFALEFVSHPVLPHWSGAVLMFFYDTWFSWPGGGETNIKTPPIPHMEFGGMREKRNDDDDAPSPWRNVRSCTQQHETKKGGEISIPKRNAISREKKEKSFFPRKEKYEISGKNEEGEILAPSPTAHLNANRGKFRKIYFGKKRARGIPPPLFVRSKW